MLKQTNFVLIQLTFSDPQAELLVFISPPQGIRFLIDSSLLKNTSEDIAQFLYKGEGLNKTAIGDYLGERCAYLIHVIGIMIHNVTQAAPGEL